MDRDAGRPAGILHVHSSRSYDGRHTVAELAAAARARGLQFLCFTDHSDTLDAEGMAALVQACEAASSTNFLAIPGVEFTCRDGLHVLGLGLRAIASETDPLAVAAFIRRHRGLAVLAHPTRKAYAIPDGLLGQLDGIEVWNCTYDGRFFPNPRSLALYDRARAANPAAVAYFGMDLHRLSNLHSTIVRLDPCPLTETAVMSALRTGRFEGMSALCRIRAGAVVSRWGRWRYEAQHLAYTRLRGLRRLLQGGKGR